MTDRDEHGGAVDPNSGDPAKGRHGADGVEKTSGRRTVRRSSEIGEIMGMGSGDGIDGTSSARKARRHHARCAESGHCDRDGPGKTPMPLTAKPKPNGGHTCPPANRPEIVRCPATNAAGTGRVWLASS
jgi:hypothetical protein